MTRQRRTPCRRIMASAARGKRGGVETVARRRGRRTVTTFTCRKALVTSAICKDKRVGSAFHLAFTINGVKSLSIVLRQVGTSTFPRPRRLVRGVTNIAKFLGGGVVTQNNSPRERALGVVPAISGGPCCHSAGKSC